jgi:hypothetical protein
MRLPGYRALLTRIHLLGTAAEKKSLSLIGEEGFRLGVPEVEPVMVDQHRLVLEPRGPAILTDLSLDPLPEFIAEWSVGKRVPFLLAADALYDSHDGSPVDDVDSDHLEPMSVR